MNSFTRIFSMIAVVLFFLAGCSGNNSPVTPGAPNDNEPSNEVTDPARETSDYTNNHILLNRSLIYIDATDPNSVEFEVVPIRAGSIHLNILKLLEVGPCTDCFKLVGFNLVEPGVLDVDIEITHPFDNLDFSVFDVRGIMMFDGSYTFPESDLDVSDPSAGDGALLNADGFTTLYNGATIGLAGDLFTYFPGKLSTPTVPNSDINGYIRHNTNYPGNIRNVFFSGDSVTQTYSLLMPAVEFVLGYAVDANWAMPLADPVVDPITDFGVDANCPEPWKIDITVDPGDPSGTVATLQIDVYDWEGSTTHAPPVVECPDLFTGTVTAAWISDETGFTRYSAEVINSSGAPFGEYICLVSVEADENDPVGKPWLDLTAYQVLTISVNFNLTDVTPDGLNFTPKAFVHSIDKLYVAASYNGLQVFDMSDPLNTSWETRVDTPGIAHDIAVSGGYAYIADSEGDLQIIDIDPIESAQIVGSLTTDGDARNIDVDGNYVYMASMTWPDSALYIINVTDPGAPVIENTIPLTSAPISVIVSNGYAYVTNGLELAIIDVDPPGAAAVVQTMAITSAMDVAISGTYAYVAARNTGLHILDINPPETASIINTVTISQAISVSVTGGYAYVACAGTFMKVIDVDPPGTAAEVASIPTQINLNDIEVFGNYALAGGANGFYLLNISVPESTHIQWTLEVPGMAEGIAAIDKYIYVASNEAGLFVLHQLSPVLVTIPNLIATEYARNITLNGNYGYISDDYSGMKIIDLSIPGSEYIVKSASGFQCNDTAIDGTYAYVAGDSAGLHILDIDPPGDTVIINTVDIGGDAEEVVVLGGYAYVTANAYPDASITVIDIDPPMSAAVVHTVPMSYQIAGIVASTDYLYVANANNGVQIIDITNPELAFIANTFIDGSNLQGIDYDSGYVFVVDINNGLRIVDVSPPETASVFASIDTEGYHLDVHVDGNYAYLAAGEGGVKIIQLY